MSATSKKVSEEDLEKQYEDYRAQFEQWKESNKSSIGTDAYNSYVSQFEQWEKDVEARKAQQRNHRRVTGQPMDEKDKEAAVAYAISQESYVQHHVKAMVHELQQRAVQHQQFRETHVSHHPVVTSTSSSVFANENVMGTVAGPSVPVNSAHTVQPVQTPPALWGNPKPIYDSRDPLFAKWGERATTAHSKIDTDSPVNPVACWMLLDTLRDRKMVLAPHSSNVPPPLITNPNCTM